MCIRVATGRRNVGNYPDFKLFVTKAFRHLLLKLVYFILFTSCVSCHFLSGNLRTDCSTNAAS